MLALLFLAYALVEWFIAKNKVKAPREKWTMLVLIAAFTTWNVIALYFHEWLTPNHLIIWLFGWLDKL
ncbi:hypothetical protein PVOR_27035 [Paenibacillus vortex V453]|uniref:Uncharacterized protein n=2 Tax=Paenibacillus TaxID=44249 RepID=A0A163FIA3_9BACL|nr:MULTISPECIES: hypothetical protein [Paenibacillus]AWP26220.1 hypothetical protein B9D94_06200 [Paenibacillus sp. Cedars]EFU38967.1 hypothetical protein PVOR_27035 [Paenibacillus vortex V453]KZS44408.1 hypothetical protein AWU65_30585 [Paenibacillus glucanolyticus]MDH6670325.1 hypothetical protein [Paenibacillus sp. LBL]MPY16558.1 hypothetical protein [Paenibacillus glucanolyticus]